MKDKDGHQKPALSRNLQLNTKGDDVKELQRRLNALGYPGADGKPLTVDGVFGPNTLHGVNAFKNAVLPGGNTGTNEGVVGQQTWDTLFSAAAAYHGQASGAARGGTTAPSLKVPAPAQKDTPNSLPQDSSRGTGGKLTADQIALNKRIFSDRAIACPIQAKGWYYSSGYPTRNINSTSTNTASHGGVDFAGVPEGTPIYSAYYGIAYKLTQTDKATGNVTGWGRYIRVDTTINNETVSLFYAHMSDWAVETGTLVEPGTVLGYIGHTGTVVGNPGNHLHFEVRFNNKHIDPYPYLQI
jgi:murein DD-endopeptidase MepM/ murein hydrolase activator NlpD